MSARISIFMVWLLLLPVLFSCVGTVPTKEVRFIDSLNRLAYSYRYKNLDVSLKTSLKAYEEATLYEAGKAEACNNLAFCAFMQMDFDKAEAYYKEVHRSTQNEIELLIADVGLMKVYQRTAMNKEFYDYRNSAIRRMKRIDEEPTLFADKQEKRRLNYAHTEFYIVSAVYYYYLQQRPEAIASIDAIKQDESLEEDTNQLLYYHYIKGSASLCQGNTASQRKLQEFDELYTTWTLATEKQYLYFEGNSVQGLANLMASQANYDFFSSRRSNVLAQFGVPVDSLLPLRLAQIALAKFTRYNDLYQIAGAYVSIGKYLNAHAQYADALDTLGKALDCVNQHHFSYYHQLADTLDKLKPYIDKDTLYTEVTWIGKERVKTVPEWISRIREQLSVSYAGLGMKAQSDYNRNSYLDILEYTRQDKELESRFQALEAESNQVNVVLSFVLIGFVLATILFGIFNNRSKARSKRYTEYLQQTIAICQEITASIPMNVERVQQDINTLLGAEKVMLRTAEDGKISFECMHKLTKEEEALLHVLTPYVDWVADNELLIDSLSEEREQLEEKRQMYEQQIVENKRQNLVKRSCLAIVNGINPYIDRIINEVRKLTEQRTNYDEKIKREKYQYIDELVTTINDYNDILGLWIKMKQGTLNLNIESFELNELFELVGKGRRAFDMKKQTLIIIPTDAYIKADRALTLFMINTLAENARKYTAEGGVVKIYAQQSTEYIEISVEDNGRGLSTQDVKRIIGEKVYDSGAIGMKDVLDAEVLKKNKGSGFGLMNCKGIIEKYHKTHDLFSVCAFDIESKPGKGSRFYFRLPLGIRRLMGILLCAVVGFTSCQEEPLPDSYERPSSSLPLAAKTTYELLLNEASDFANSAYYANINQEYEWAIQYADSALQRLNKHYATYARSPHQYMTLVGEGTPVEIAWWNERFDTDFHIILDVRNEAAVAFLALKQLDAYTYNNTAYTTLYKLLGEDRSIELYCRQLERSTTNKTVGIILCVIILATSLFGYYILYIRKRWLNRWNLEQVLEINKKVFAASLQRTSETLEMLQREEDTLKDIPQHIVNEAFDAVNDLLTIKGWSIAVYNEAAHRLEFASTPQQDRLPEIVQCCFEEQSYQTDGNRQLFPLLVEAGGEHQCVGVLCIERREGTELETDRLLCEMIARYVAIVVFNAVVKLAVKYRDIESAYEETHRASWEDDILHVQNMVLDNCLSTIKHETIYYPNKIKQIISQINSKTLTESEEIESIQAISELIEYYKGVFTILSTNAARQLEEITFRRTTVSVHELLDYAAKYFLKIKKRNPEQIELITDRIEGQVLGDVSQLRFLLENLLDEAVAVKQGGKLILRAAVDGEYIRFLFTDTRREKSVEELNQLFYPNLARMTGGEGDDLRGTEYLLCKQIIRDHDEFAAHRGCRINAIPATGGGFTVYFTIPRQQEQP